MTGPSFCEQSILFEARLTQIPENRLESNLSKPEWDFINTTRVLLSLAKKVLTASTTDSCRPVRGKDSLKMKKNIIINLYEFTMIIQYWSKNKIIKDGKQLLNTQCKYYSTNKNQHGENMDCFNAKNNLWSLMQKTISGTNTTQERYTNKQAKSRGQPLLHNNGSNVHMCILSHSSWFSSVILLILPLRDFRMCVSGIQHC